MKSIVKYSLFLMYVFGFLGTVPSFMTQVNITGVKRSFYATDNFTWLAPGESKQWVVEALWREASANAVLTIGSWNAPALSEKLMK